MGFKPVSPKVDFPALERQILDWWYKSGIVKQYLDKNKSSKKRFSFLDGPITANNPMGVHHAWGRTYKDLWQRFFNYRGYKQRFQNGFDNQGLWVEVEVEKELGFKSKKDIEKFGIENFVNKCKERTLKFAKVQTEQSKRLGYFVDWDNSYYTMSNENNYMIWSFLKRCYENHWLYKGHDSVPWCPRCGTAISQHEIATEEYKVITHTSVFLKFPKVGNSKTYFLVWTTTPWTILANVALAVNPDLTYGEFEVEGEDGKLIFVKELASRVLEGKKWKLIREMKGTELGGGHYLGPFDDLPRVKKAEKENPQTFHSVVLDKDLVSAEEGTGVVHIAPGAGSEDFILGKREKLPVIEAIDENAVYIEGLGEFEGKNAKNDPQIIFDALKKKDGGKFLFKLEDYTHRYPICWRCKTELVWRVVDEWYISMGELRFKIMESAKKAGWLPSWGLEREIDWLKNMDDWLISKKRYWGLALPIWECKKCGHFDVIGSFDELKVRAVEGFKKFEGRSPHRPWIDEVKIKCSKCGEVSSRIPDVGNPWLDAGIVPFSTLVDPKTGEVSYLTDKKYWKEWFPADFVTESFPGQFKNWFYSLLTMSTVLEDTNPFKTLLGYALVRDEKGEEMHKSKGNAIDFSQAAEEIGVDVMRWMYATQNPELNLNFGYNIADETRRKFHLRFWNIYNFFVTYANVDGFRPQNYKVSENVLDRWITSKLNKLIKSVTDSLEKYDVYNASHQIEGCVDDLSTWYVRRSRDRVGPSAHDQSNKNNFYQTLYLVLVDLCKILAPFTPFMVEDMYKNLTNEISVHLTDWPSVNASMIDENLELQMEGARKICEIGHAIRKEAGIKVRQPLSKLSYSGPTLSKELTDLIASEVNVKEVVQKSTKGDLGADLDMVITPKLASEGKARELIRQIQELRKEVGCRIDEEIIAFLPDYPEGLADYIMRETLATKIEKGPLSIKKLSS